MSSTIPFVLVAGLAASLLTPGVAWIWRTRWIPWWESEIATRLHMLGWHRLTALHRLPVQWIALLALTGLWKGGGPGALLGMIGGIGLVMALPWLLDRVVASHVGVADEDFARLLPEFASGVATGEETSSLLKRLADMVCPETTGGDARWNPLVRDLILRSAGASRLSPSLSRVCDEWDASPVPSARLAAIAWRGLAQGVNVPSAFREISRLTLEDRAFRAKVDGQIQPLHVQSVVMGVIPILVLAGWLLQDPGLWRGLMRPPACFVVLGGFVVLAAAQLWFQLCLRSLR